MKYLLCLLVVMSTACNANSKFKTTGDIQNYLDERLAKVIVNAGTSTMQGSGGFILSPHGKLLVLTNEHVCAPSILKQVLIKEINQESIGTIVKADAGDDLCVIDVTPLFPQHKTLPLAIRSNKELLLTSGYGMGHYIFSWGVIIGIDTMGSHPIYWSSMFATFGQSGSPVINPNGELVGVVEVTDELRNAGYIPIEVVKPFLADL